MKHKEHCEECFSTEDYYCQECSELDLIRDSRGFLAVDEEAWEKQEQSYIEDDLNQVINKERMESDDKKLLWYFMIIPAVAGLILGA